MKKNIILYSSLLGFIIIMFVAIMLYLVVLYPIRYKDTIRKYGEIYNIDPEIICSIINIESGFDKNAESSVGARGLMQIMPNTAYEIADKLNISDFTLDMLFSPEINIRMGCYYINYLASIYEDLDNIVASYNAGFNKVNEWLKSEEYSSNGVVDKPPIKETKQYIKKFHKNLNVYKNRIN